MQTIEKKTKKMRRGSYFVGNKRFRGRLPNGRISFNLKENNNCVELAKMGMAHRTISENLGLTVNQVVYRLNKIGISVMRYRRGESQEAKVILNRFRVSYKD